MNDYLATGWRMASGRFGLEMRTRLEGQLQIMEKPSVTDKPKVFFGLYHAPEQVFLNREFKRIGLTSSYETLDFNPGFPMVDVHHNMWSPDIYREHAGIDENILTKTNHPVANTSDLDQLLRFFLRNWEQYDVFHFNWFMSFLPDNIDVEYIRRSGRLVYFQLHGCFVIYHNKELVKFTTRGESVVQMCALCHQTGWREEYFSRWYRGIAHANRVFVTNPCWIHCSPNFEYLPSLLESSLSALPAVELKRKPRNQTLVVLHAPSNPYIKGTPFVQKAVEELRQEGLNVELQVIQKLSRAEAMKKYGDGDVFIEQLHLGSYGNTAIEAMAHGIPVISSNHPAHAHLAPGCPIVHADPLTVKDRLRELLLDYDLRAEIGARCYSWVRDFHGSERISKHLLNIYKEDMGLSPKRKPNILQNKEPRYEA